MAPESQTSTLTSANPMPVFYQSPTRQKKTDSFTSGSSHPQIPMQQTRSLSGWMAVLGVVPWKVFFKRTVPSSGSMVLSSQFRIRTVGIVSRICCGLISLLGQVSLWVMQVSLRRKMLRCSFWVSWGILSSCLGSRRRRCISPGNHMLVCD